MPAPVSWPAVPHGTTAPAVCLALARGYGQPLSVVDHAERCQAEQREGDRAIRVSRCHRLIDGKGRLIADA